MSTYYTIHSADDALLGLGQSLDAALRDARPYAPGGYGPCYVVTDGQPDRPLAPVYHDGEIVRYEVIR